MFESLIRYGVILYRSRASFLAFVFWGKFKLIRWVGFFLLWLNLLKSEWSLLGLPVDYACQVFDLSPCMLFELFDCSLVTQFCGCCVYVV